MREGEKNGRSKLTWDLVREIRQRYRKGDSSTYKLSLDYDMAQSTIHDIVAGDAWQEKRS